MGYTLIIGEAKVNTYEHTPDWGETGLDESCYVTAEPVHDENSPAFGDPTDHTNERWPSYTAWHDFCKFEGLERAMYEIDQHGQGHDFRGGHPGIFPINADFKKEVDNAYERHMTKYPNAVAEYDTERPQDYHLCRLLWLKYWTDWALDNCKFPIMANS